MRANLVGRGTYGTVQELLPQTFSLFYCLSKDLHLDLLLSLPLWPLPLRCSIRIIFYV